MADVIPPNRTGCSRVARTPLIRARTPAAGRPREAGAEEDRSERGHQAHSGEDRSIKKRRDPEDRQPGGRLPVEGPGDEEGGQCLSRLEESKPSPIARANPTNRGPVKPSGGSTSWFILESLVVPSRGRLNPVSGLPECPRLWRRPIRLQREDLCRCVQ